MRFISFFLILVVAIAAAGSLSFWFGFVPSIPLAILITAAAFLATGELAALCLLSIWLLGFAPVLSAEAVALFFIPLFWSLVHRFSPARPWVINVMGGAIGIALFYASLHSWSVFDEPFIVRDIFFSAAASAAVFAALRPFFSLSHEKHW